ncbi:TlpA family protein disulfide reductase [Candidatus Poriferisodalis sp.]|uniref:TlpA family protein disulfide reductase n=1 Tax=Candidatus Poriferisodalis sp. TaxID=3101277 RepID=UPI003B01EAD5
MSEPAATDAASATTTPSGAAPDRTQVSGTALPQFEQLEDDPAVGRQAPLVVGADLLTGAEVRIENQGRPMVVAFYAHWCPHCQAEVEALTGWLETNELPVGVDFYAVSVLEDATRGNHPPDKWLRDEGWQHPVVVDTPARSVVDAFGLVSVPYLVAVDADNEVVLRFAGNVGPDDLAAFFESLLAAGT